MHTRGFSWLAGLVFWWGSAALAAPAQLPSVNALPETASPILTLEQATAQALQGSLSLQGARAAALAAHGRLLQAGVRPNPAVSMEAEDLALWGTARGGSQITLRAGQRIELGGKRESRSRVAEAHWWSADRWTSAESSLVRAEVRRRYTSLQAARARAQLADESIRIAEEMVATVSRKAAAGAIAPAAVARAEAEQANARLALSDARADAGLAATRLVALWGGPADPDIALAAIPASLPPVPARGPLADQSANAPGIRALRARVESAERNLDLQQRLPVPDVELAAGVRRSWATDNASFLLGLSVPLPVRDRNRGNIAAAAAEIDQARAALALASRDNLLALDNALATLRRAIVKRETLRSEIVPATRRAYDDVFTGFTRGRLGYVDVLDARRAFLTAAHAEIDAYVAHAHALALMENALGGTAGAPLSGQQE